MHHKCKSLVLYRKLQLKLTIYRSTNDYSFSDA